jgi:hypothetical protein
MVEINRIIQKKETSIKKLKKKETFIGFFRICSFLIFSIFLLVFFINNLINYGHLCFSIFGLFVYISLGVFLINVQEEITFHANSLKICDEINDPKFSDKQFHHFDLNHLYCSDLDILGENSLFSRINHAKSYLGKEKLKTFLLKNLIQTKEIYERQDSIKELSGKLEWSVLFLTFAQNLNINKEFFNSPPSIFKSLDSKFLKLILLFFPIVNICFIIACFVLNISLPVISIFCLLILISSTVISYRYSKKAKQILSLTELNANQYEQFVSVFSLIEKENFNSNLNSKLRANLFLGKEESATSEIRKLSRLLSNYENGKTPIFGAILNIFTLWNLQYLTKIEKQMLKLKDDLPIWIDVFSDFEALICLGIFAYKNSEYTFPVCCENTEDIEMLNIYHPFLSSENIVANSFSINNENNISVITGANMTGKSTFLRAIGVNLVLAMNGCPVAAEKFSFYPMKIFTSMRTNDSLNDGTSYFNAEIKKLKILIENLENNIPQYIILDEILKGTNSKDKLTGSKLFLEKLMKFKTPLVCIIATHDLDLTEMEKEHPNNVRNYCFELKQNNEELEADYKLSVGVTKTMNAIRLMRKFKIID